MKKEKYPERVEIFTFLLEYRFVWRPRFFKKKQKTKNKKQKKNKKNRLMVIWSENVFKGNFMLQSFHGQRDFDRENFLDGEHMKSSSTKTA